MSTIVRIKWELGDGTLATGFDPCPTDSPPNFALTHGDVNLGVLSSAEASRVYVLKGTPYKLDSALGIVAPNSDITNLKIFLSPYISALGDEGLFCDGQPNAELEGYQGSRNPDTDKGYLISLGDSGFGIHYSLDRGRSFTPFSTLNGNPDDALTHILVPTTAMSIGRTNGVLQSNDIIEIHLKMVMPEAISSSEIGLRQFMLGSSYSFTD